MVAGQARKVNPGQMAPFSVTPIGYVSPSFAATGSTLKSLNPKISASLRNLNRLAPSLRLGPNR